jgi:hypothetical protein
VDGGWVRNSSMCVHLWAYGCVVSSECHNDVCHTVVHKPACQMDCCLAGSVCLCNRMDSDRSWSPGKSKLRTCNAKADQEGPAQTRCMTWAHAYCLMPHLGCCSQLSGVRKTVAVACG